MWAVTSPLLSWIERRRLTPRGPFVMAPRETLPLGIMTMAKMGPPPPPPPPPPSGGNDDPLFADEPLFGRGHGQHWELVLWVRSAWERLAANGRALTRALEHFKP